MKKFIRRYTPEHRTIRENRHLNRIFGTLLHDPHLLHLNRRSVSMAFLIGLFWAFVPMPFQMIPAALFAIWWRANLPIAVGLVWISNPVTIPPLYYATYVFGTWLMGMDPLHVEFTLTWEWFTTELALIWQPLYLGSLLTGTISGIAGYGLVRLLWRLHIVRFLKRKKLERAQREKRKRKR